jgi:hypothetical protein
MNYLINITALPPGSNTPQVLRFCAGMPGGFASSPTDTPPNAVWRPGVLTPFHFSREMFGGDSAGASRIGAGEIVLANDDGWLDRYDAEGWAFAGQRVEVLAGLPGVLATEYVPVFRGVIQEVELSWGKLTLQVRDRQKELDKPLPIPKYAGTNSGPTGIEGGSSLKDKFKPLCVGPNFNVEPVEVNASALIFQVNFRSVQAIPAAYLNAGALTFSADYADETLLKNATIAGGHYATCLAKGLLRVNSLNNQKLTCDVQGDNVGGYVSDTAGILRRLLEILGWTSADWSEADLLALAAAQPAPQGIYDAAGSKARVLMDAVAAGPWVWYCPDRLGLMRFGRVEAPAGTPVAHFTDDYHLELERDSSDLAGAPWGLVTVQAERNWCVLKDGNVAGGLPEGRREWVGQEYRDATSTADGLPDPAILARYPLTETEGATSQGLFTVHADALAEAQRRAAYRSVPRRAFTQRVPMEYGYRLELGQCVTLSSRRFGLDRTLVRINRIDDVSDANYVELQYYG